MSEEDHAVDVLIKWIQIVGFVYTGFIFAAGSSLWVSSVENMFLGIVLAFLTMCGGVAIASLGVHVLREGRIV